MVEYLKTKNATQAYQTVYGCSRATADANGPALLGIARVRAEIDRLEAIQLAAVQAETGITLERTLREIARMAFHDPRRFFDEHGRLRQVTSLDDDTASALAGFEVFEEFAGAGREREHIGDTKKIKITDRAKALDMLMKHLGGYEKDNSQKGAVVGDVMRDFFENLHQAGAGRAKPVRRQPE